MSETATTFYVTGGTLRLDAPSYVERKADTDLLEGVLAGEFCYVLTSRQMGKSSLMVRTANKLRERSVQVIVLDLSAVGQNITLEQWYFGLLSMMGEQLGIEYELDEFWAANQTLSPVQRWFNAVAKVVLSQRSGPVVVFIDEIDVVRSLPFSTDEFFAAIRECYNRRATDPEFKSLTFCLLGVATPSDLVRDTNITPFNIGRRIDLDDFTPEEASPLGRGLHVDGPTAPKPLKRVLYWTGGHPYLTQRLCQNLARDLRANNSGDVDQRCEDLFLNKRARERDDNLIFVRERLLRSEVDLADLLELYLKVWNREPVSVDEASGTVNVLRLSGIVRSEAGRLVERNRIYHRVFDRAWVRTNLPDAELRRQKEAFRRGVFRTTAIAAIVIIAMSVMVLIAADKTRKARSALAESNFSRAQAKRGSGSSGQRYESVAALKEANRYYTNRAKLREELIACLALPDLKENLERYRLPDKPDVYEIHPDRRIWAAAETDGTIILRSFDDPQFAKSIPGFGSPVRRLRFAPEQDILLAEYGSESSGETILWNAQKAERLFTLPHGTHAQAVDFSRDGKKMAIGRANAQLTVYSLPGGEIVFDRALKLESGLPRVPHAIRFDPSGENLAESCLDDPDVQIWDLQNPKSNRRVRLYHRDAVNDLSWHPSGAFLATACKDSRIYLWNLARPEEALKQFRGHESGVTAVTFNHRGTMLASTGSDETIRLWTPANEERQVVFPLEATSFDRLGFSAADDELIATNGGSDSHRVWKIFGEEYLALQFEAGSLPQTIDFSPDGRWLAAAAVDRTTIWDSSTGAECAIVTIATAHAGAFSWNSRTVIASTDDGLFEYSFNEPAMENGPPSKGGMARSLPHSPEKSGNQEQLSQLGTMAMAADRSTVAVVNIDDLLLVSTATNCLNCIRRFPLGRHYQRVALDPGKTWLAAHRQNQNSVDLWRLTGGSQEENPVRLPGNEYFAFSTDGKWLVTCWEGAFRFYRVGAWDKIALSIPRERGSNLHAPVAFSPDGSIVALALNLYSIELIRLSDDALPAYRSIGTLKSPDRLPLEKLAFSPDGRRLAASTAGPTVQLWNLALLRASLANLNLQEGWPPYE